MKLFRSGTPGSPAGLIASMIGKAVNTAIVGGAMIAITTRSSIRVKIRYVLSFLLAPDEKSFFWLHIVLPFPAFFYLYKQKDLIANPESNFIRKNGVKRNYPAESPPKRKENNARGICRERYRTDAGTPW